MNAIKRNNGKFSTTVPFWYHSCCFAQDWHVLLFTRYWELRWLFLLFKNCDNILLNYESHLYWCDNNILFKAVDKTDSFNIGVEDLEAIVCPNKGGECCAEIRAYLYVTGISIISIEEIFDYLII